MPPYKALTCWNSKPSGSKGRRQAAGPVWQQCCVVVTCHAMQVGLLQRLVTKRLTQKKCMPCTSTICCAG